MNAPRPTEHGQDRLALEGGRQVPVSARHSLTLVPENVADDPLIDPRCSRVGDEGVAEDMETRATLLAAPQCPLEMIVTSRGRERRGSQNLRKQANSLRPCSLAELPQIFSTEGGT